MFQKEKRRFVRSAKIPDVENPGEMKYTNVSNDYIREDRYLDPYWDTGNQSTLIFKWYNFTKS